MSDRLCKMCGRIARIFGVRPACENGRCSLTVPLEEVVAEIRGRRVGGAIDLSFSDLDGRDRALGLFEVTLFEEQVNPFILEVQNRGLLVTALHNHWLFDRPRLLYIHGQAIMNPVRFAVAVKRAVKVALQL